MSWNQGGGNGGGPWGQGGGNPWGGRPPGGGPQRPDMPPDLDEILRRSQEQFSQMLPKNVGPVKALVILAIVVLALIGASGFYTVRDGQVGVVQRFGAVVRSELPGLQWRLPYFERVSVVSVSQVFRLEVAGRAQTTGSASSLARLDEPISSRMVTSDRNLVEVDFTVLWQVSDPEKYLFSLRDPEGTLRMAAESVVREIVGRSGIDDLIPTASAADVAATVAEEPAAAGSLSKLAIAMQDELQRLVNSYDAGIRVTDLQLTRVAPPAQVADAFTDVIKARQEASSAINQAKAYANTTRAEAQGQASRIKAEADAYKAQIVSKAQGDADRFSKVYQAYSLSENTTATRLYLETMEQVFKGANKVIMEGGNSQGVLPYLPLSGAARTTSSGQ